jgi:hypothetical protein
MNVQFMDDVEQEAADEREAHVEFYAEQQQRREAAAAEESSDNDDEWSGPDPEDKGVGQRAILPSFETLNKAKDEANEALH